MSRRLTTAVIFTLALVASAQSAQAQRADLSNSPPIKSAMPLRDARHQLTPVFGFTINDLYQRNLAVGIDYRYYFTDWLGVGLDFMATYYHFDTSLTKSIDSQLTRPGQSGHPSTSSLQTLTHVAVNLVPVFGKFIAFRKLPMAYDLHIVVGLGLGTWTGQGRIENGMHFSPMIGVGGHFFFSNWIALNLEVRDYMMIKMPVAAQASATNPESKFVNNWMFTVGVTFMLPPEVQREL